MANKEKEELTRIHLHIFTSDFEKLKMLYGDNMGHTQAVRLIVRKFLRGLEEHAGGRNVKVNPEDLGI